VSWCQLNSKGVIEATGRASYNADDFDTLSDIYRRKIFKKRALIYISVSSELNPYFVMRFDNIPSKKIDREKYVRWRLKAELGVGLVDVSGDVALIQKPLPIYGDKNFIAVSWLKSEVGLFAVKAESRHLFIEQLSPFGWVIEEMAISVCTTVNKTFIYVLLADDAWHYSLIINGQSYFYRSHVWGRDLEKSVAFVEEGVRELAQSFNLKVDGGGVVGHVFKEEFRNVSPHRVGMLNSLQLPDDIVGQDFTESDVHVNLCSYLTARIAGTGYG